MGDCDRYRRPQACSEGQGVSRLRRSPVLGEVLVACVVLARCGMALWRVKEKSEGYSLPKRVTLYVAVLVLIAGFLSDVAYAALDPRDRVS